MPIFLWQVIFKLFFLEMAYSYWTKHLWVISNTDLLQGQILAPMIIFLTTTTQYLVDIIHNGFVDDKTIILQCYHSRDRFDRVSFNRKIWTVSINRSDQNRTISSNQFTKVELNSTPWVLLCCWVWKILVRWILPAPSGSHDVYSIFSFKENRVQ